MKRIYLSIIALLMVVYGFAQTDDSPDSTLAKTVSFEDIKPDVKLYPNPAINKVSLKVTRFDPGMVAVKIIDLNGTPLKEEQRLLINGSEEEVVLFFFLPPGIYFVVMQQRQKIVRRKLIIS